MAAKKMFHDAIAAGLARRAAQAMEATRPMPCTGAKGSGGRLGRNKPPLTAAAMNQMDECAARILELQKESQARRLAGDTTVERLDNGIDAETRRRILERKKLTQELTDDTVNSEAKLHALYLKWLAINVDYHFDVEDEKAFKDRYESYPKKPNQVIAGLAEYMDKKAN